MSVKSNSREENPFKEILKRQAQLNVLQPPTHEELLRGWPDPPKIDGNCQFSSGKVSEKQPSPAV